MSLSRREWIRLGLPLVAGARVWAAAPQGLDQFAAAVGPPCSDKEQPTPAVAHDATYKAGAPVRASLVETGVIGVPLAFSGTVTGVTCGRIKGATVELWQADAHGVYDTIGFRLRGKQLTDAQGQFAFQTIVPGDAAARARHLGVHVVVPGKTEFWTELFFPDTPKNASDRRFKKELLLKTLAAPSGHQAVAYDIVLGI